MTVVVSGVVVTMLVLASPAMRRTVTLWLVRTIVEGFRL